jgi:hypothetical protein
VISRSLVYNSIFILCLYTSMLSVPKQNAPMDRQ